MENIIEFWQEKRKQLLQERILKAKYPFLYRRFENPEIRGTYNPEFMKGILRSQTVYAKTFKNEDIPVIDENDRNDIIENHENIMKNCRMVATELIPNIALPHD